MGLKKYAYISKFHSDKGHGLGTNLWILVPVLKDAFGPKVKGGKKGIPVNTWDSDITVCVEEKQ